MNVLQTLLVHFFLKGTCFFTIPGWITKAASTVINLQHGMYQSGDLILGGLFSVHLSEKNGDLCTLNTSTFIRHNFQMVEAMKFAVNSINKESHILPGIRLGYDIKDICGTVDNSMRATLNFSFVKKYLFMKNTCDLKSELSQQEQSKFNYLFFLILFLG